MSTENKVLIVDDHPLFRDALELAITRIKAKTFTIHHAGSISEAQTALKSDSFTLILLDLNMDDSTDFEGVSKVLGRNGETPILIVSATETPQAYATAKSMGVAGYIPKSLSLPEITHAIETVLNGGTSFPEGIKAANGSGLKAAENLASLTPAQQRVMSCLSDGLLNKQIAFKMSISEATVKAHMTAIFRKLGANNRTQALLMFREATRL